jgi:hypothetical protein
VQIGGSAATVKSRKPYKVIRQLTDPEPCTTGSRNAGQEKKSIFILLGLPVKRVRQEGFFYGSEEVKDSHLGNHRVCSGI